MNVSPGDRQVLSEDGVTRVVRVGMTVRRPVRPFTSTVQSFLAFLWARGVRCIPEPLGVDGDGREVLGYVEGDVPHEPLPDWATSEAVLVALGRLIRSLHDTAEGWSPPADATWGSIPGSCSFPEASNDAGPMLVAHHDYCPGNVVFRAGLPAALIDFDLARPTTRASDCVNALYWWAPLLDPRDRAPALATADIPLRCRVFADAYSMTRGDRERIAAVAAARSRSSPAAMRSAARLDPVFRRWWDEGVGEKLQRAREWMALNEEAIRDELLA